MFKYLAARKLIKKNGRTVRWTADQVGLSYNTLVQYLKGYQVPSRQRIDKLAEVLQIRVDEIWTDEPPHPECRCAINYREPTEPVKISQVA